MPRSSQSTANPTASKKQPNAPLNEGANAAEPNHDRRTAQVPARPAAHHQLQNPGRLDAGAGSRRAHASQSANKLRTSFLHIAETDCVADDTVRREPVSTSNSLLAGNLQGIFEDFRLIRQFSSPFSE